MIQKSIDIYKEFRLGKPLSGLVRKVISPKGIRTIVGEGYVYSLKSELSGIYAGEEMILTPGLYHVSCVCKPESEVVWNHYLFVMTKDGTVYPVAEYLHQSTSEWVRKAIHIVKSYFEGNTIKPIKLTKVEHKSVKATSWKLLKK